MYYVKLKKKTVTELFYEIKDYKVSNADNSI